MCQELLNFKIIRLIERDKFRIRQFNFTAANLLLEIPIFIVPEDDPALIELRERRGKPAV